MLLFGNCLTYFHCRDENTVNKICLIAPSKEKKNLIQGILICISCGSDNVKQEKHMLCCMTCNYANFYEVA